MIKLAPRRPLLFVKRYSNSLHDYLSSNSIKNLYFSGQFLGISFTTAFLAFIFLNNITPFGVTVKYELQSKGKNISELSPADRVKTVVVNENKIYKQIDDLVYFTTNVPFQFDHATMRITYKNSSSDQIYSVGYQDGEGWHYQTKPFDIPYLNTIDWVRNGYNPTLYQKEQNYISVEEFQQNPPKNAIIGTAEYASTLNNTSYLRLNDYKANETNTTIHTALRGKHTFYTYLENEPFVFKIYKQDLNWYEDPDIVNVKVYKGNELVHEVHAEDDGIVENNHKVLPPQEIVVRNPGKELPENGVYKIVVEATGDVVIKKIVTNLHKLVIANSVYPVANKEAYPNIVASTSATTLYTNALTLAATTYHKAGMQNILVGNQILGVNTLNTASYLPPKEDISKVVIPQNDVILNGFMGYFAFSEDQFFLPTKYHVLPITKKEDVGLVDYILTDYRPSWKEGDWQVNEQFFDLRDAYIKDGKLSWVIKAPKLKERGGEVIIKDIQITFHKKGWL